MRTFQTKQAHTFRLVQAVAILLVTFHTSSGEETAAQKTIHLRVVGPDGQPAAQAEVFVSTPSRSAAFDNGRIRSRGSVPTYSTNAAGECDVPDVTMPASIIVMSDTGFAEIAAGSVTRDNPIILQPWGRVEGELRIGRRPGAREPMVLSYDLHPAPMSGQAFHRYVAVCDEEGRFLFERVAPGEARVSREVKTPNGAPFWSHGVPIRVRPGETSRVTVGGTGRPVEGRITLPKRMRKGTEWVWSQASIHSANAVPPVSGPDMTAERAEELRQAYRERRIFAVRVQPNGSFRAEDVPTGEYVLTITVCESLRGKAFPGRELGRIRHRFTMPEVPEGWSSKPLNLGALAFGVRDRSH